MTKDKSGWITYLNKIALTCQNNTMKTDEKIERKLPKNIKQMKKVDLQTAIATIVTYPNKKWKNVKREKYMVPKSYFQNN